MTVSLAICVSVPTGIALSADSRTTARTTTAPQPVPGNPNLQQVVETNLVLSDDAHKLFLLFSRFGVMTVGDAIVNRMPIGHYIGEYEAGAQGAVPQSVDACAQAVLAFFRGLNPIPAVAFVVAGYDGQVPWIAAIDVGQNTATRQNTDAAGQVKYGVMRGGDTAVVDRLLSQQQFNPAFDLMPLQDAADYSRHLVRTTIDQLRFEPRFATVGGPIDTLVLQPTGVKWLASKTLRAS